LTFAREAGLGRVSLPSAVAATMVAYGTFAVLLALVGGIAARIAGSGTSALSSNDWQNLGAGAGIAVALLAVSYLFGGQGTTGKFHFNLVASNGETVATSDSYTSKESATKGVDAVRRAAAEAVVDNQTPALGA